MQDSLEPETARAEVVPWKQWLGQRILSLSFVAMTIVAATTFAGLFARLHWVADLFTNLRVQQVIGLVVVAVIFAIARSWRSLAASLVLLAIHLPWFIPAFATTEIPAGEPDLVVMTFNVLTRNREYQSIEDQIHDANADVVAILELGSPLHSHLENNLSATYPHRVTIPQDDGNFGIGLYSRFPLSGVSKFALNVASIQSIAANVSAPSGEYRIIATHPLPPVGRRGFRRRNEHLDLLTERISDFRQANDAVPLIVAGDFNLTPWSPMFNDFEAGAGLTRCGRGFGLAPTWYAMKAFPGGLQLDHVLTSPELRCVTRRVGADSGSDHRAVIVGLARKDPR